MGYGCIATKTIGDQMLFDLDKLFEDVAGFVARRSDVSLLSSRFCLHESRIRIVTLDISNTDKRIGFGHRFLADQREKTLPCFREALDHLLATDEIDLLIMNDGIWTADFSLKSPFNLSSRRIWCPADEA